MKVYIVTHEHGNEESCSTSIVSGHLSREKAEKSLKDEKEECIKEYWEDYETNDDVEVDHDIAGLFEIHDRFSCERDEILIQEVEIKD